MKIYFIAIVLVALIMFFVGIFTAAVLIESSVKKAVFQAFDYYIETNGYEENSTAY